MTSTVLRYSLAVLLLASTVAHVVAQQPPPPGAVDQASPSDYALLEADALRARDRRRLGFVLSDGRRWRLSAIREI